MILVLSHVQEIGSAIAKLYFKYVLMMTVSRVRNQTFGETFHQGLIRVIAIWDAYRCPWSSVSVI